ncbi:insulin-like [Centropristis striata]|uniref:insulin-like n=1 Tax=Centropristis striata TaxID=184440 RepID=UPI0027E0E211|nr:insulin-like [Centropristis striata]
MVALWLQSVSLLVLLVVLWPGCQASPGQRPICGSHLVDALYLVCGEKGFFGYHLSEKEIGDAAYRDEVWKKISFSFWRQCCFQTCSIYDLVYYCD